MSKTLIFSASASRAFDALPADVRERLLRALFRYGQEGHGDIKKMKNGSTMRMRDGDYRIIIEEQADSFHIFAVGHRRNIYR